MQNISIKRFLWLLVNYGIWADYRRKRSIMHTELDLIGSSFLAKIHFERLPSSYFFLTLIGQASLLLLRNIACSLSQRLVEAPTTKWRLTAEEIVA